MAQAQEKIDWRKCSPQQKAAIIGNLYDPKGTSASDMSHRIYEAHGAVVSRNAVIGTYGRIPELREKYPLTGGSKTKSTSTSQKSPFMARLLQQQKEQRRMAREEKKRLEQERKEARQKALEAPGEDGVSRMARIEARAREISAYDEEYALKLTLVDLEPHHCRWPTGSSNFTFCGVDRKDGTPYCTFHARLAYNPR